ncbi:hypothetical protein J4558_19460 [Leptolyngbya sp. 15MV]|nr:hypothetical protein J4558_19460 [Leptolyngbya sp. 15MV]
MAHEAGVPRDKAGDVARTGQGKLGEAAADRGGDAADTARRLTRQLSAKASQSVKNVRSRLPH